MTDRVRLAYNEAVGAWIDVVDEKGTIVSRMVNLHNPVACSGKGRGCGIHNRPTNHSLKDAPMYWSNEQYALERECVHGLFHPDHDSALYLKSVGLEHFNFHNCDGCCSIR